MSPLLVAARRRRYVLPGVGAAILATLTTAVAAVAIGPASDAPAAHPSPSATPSVLLATAPAFDLAPFRAIAHKPAATAPLKRLPKVDTATVTVAGIPPVALQAYRSAAHRLAQTAPGCHVSWWLVAGIGLVESGHAASGGSRHAGWNGVARPPIYGPELDGSHGYMAIRDTDNAVYDGDRRWDRAVGPMQFLPSTWRTWGPPDGSGRASPQNIRAAALATAAYLCAGGLDLSQSHAMALAVYSYNHSFDYVRLVLSVAARYAGMSPAELGVDLLPRDRPAHKHHARHKHDGARNHKGTARATATATATPSASASASPTPTPEPTTDGTVTTVSPAPVPTILPSLSVG